MPAEIVDKLNGAINAVVTDAALQDRARHMGNTAASDTPAEFGKLIAADTAKVGEGRAVRRHQAGVIMTLDELLHRVVPMARDQMIVDHAGRLHEGVDDGRAAELEAALREFLGHGARDGGFGRDLPRGLVVIDLRFAVEEIP